MQTAVWKKLISIPTAYKQLVWIIDPLNVIALIDLISMIYNRNVLVYHEENYRTTALSPCMPPEYQSYILDMNHFTDFECIN